LNVGSFENFIDMKPGLIKVEELENEYQQKLEKLKDLETKMDELRIKKIKNEEELNNKIQQESKNLIEKVNLNFYPRLNIERIQGSRRKSLY